MLGGVSVECNQCAGCVCSSKVRRVTASAAAVVQQHHTCRIHSPLHTYSQRRVRYRTQVRIQRNGPVMWHASRSLTLTYLLSMMSLLPYTGIDAVYKLTACVDDNRQKFFSAWLTVYHVLVITTWLVNYSNDVRWPLLQTFLIRFMK